MPMLRPRAHAPSVTTLGQRLRAARHAQKRSLLDVAKDVYKRDGTQITPQYLGKIEADDRQPSLEVLVGLAHALHLDTLELLRHSHGAEHVVRTYLRYYPAQEGPVIAFFHSALTQHFQAWEPLRQRLLTR